MNKLIRKPDWPERLAAYLKRCEDKEFIRGRHDCALFAAHAVKQISNKDFAAGFRGKYKTARGASTALKKYGAGTLFETVTAFLGNPYKTPLLAKRGDVVGVMQAEGATLGICTGKEIALVAKIGGLIYLPITKGIYAWRV